MSIPGNIEAKAICRDWRLWSLRPGLPGRSRPSAQAVSIQARSSGNPKGARRKPRSLALDLKALFQRALSKKITLRQGEKQCVVTMASAGIEQLVIQFAKGDRHARRDLFALFDRFGIDF